MSELPRRLDPMIAIGGASASVAASDEVCDLASRVGVRFVATLEALAAVRRFPVPVELEDALRELDDEVKDAFAEAAVALGDLAAWLRESDEGRRYAEGERDANERALDRALDDLSDGVEAALTESRLAHKLVLEGVSPGWLSDDYEVRVERAARDTTSKLEELRTRLESVS